MSSFEKEALYHAGAAIGLLDKVSVERMGRANMTLNEIAAAQVHATLAATYAALSGKKG